MRFAILLLFLVAAASSAPAHAFDRSLCKQYGGSANCWTPVIGPWKYGVCGEWGSGAAGALFEAAFCEARGGTWAGGGCQGLPPVEYRRPTSEGDMRPLAEATYTGRYEPLCEGPSVEGFGWGGVYGSVNCGNGNGATFNSMGYEVGNSATPFAASGKLLLSGVCNANDTVIGFKGSRGRAVHCSSVKQGEDFISTSGGTPALCNLGFRQPIDPKQPCTGCGSVKVGNPIDPSSGVKQQIELDYAGSGPHPLRFERIYNSRVYTRDGRQWRHNYSAHIENQEFGTVPVVVAHRANGQAFLFKLTAGQYLPDTDINDRITRLTDGGGALTGWEYYDAASDANELYDVEGKLLYLINRAGLAHTLEYSTAATPPAIAPAPGYLIRVIDSFGRELNFTHDLFGRLATMLDPAGQTYLYESTTLNHFASVTYPDGKSRTYLYNEAGFVGTNTYDGRLTGLIDENEVRFGSYFYDFFAMATRSTQPNGVNNTVLNAGAWPSSVNVTDARGTLRTYGYASVNGAYRNTFIRQPAVSGVGTVQSTMTYTGSGNLLTRVDFNGNRTNYTSYDTARNLELSRTEGLTAAGATTPQTRTISTQWDPVFRLPTGIAEPLRITTNVYDPDGSACGARGMLCSKSIQATTDANGSLGFSAVPTGTARTWTYTYNANGSLLTANGPRTDVTDVTTYLYYANDDPDLAKRGQLESITNAAGHVTSFTAYNVHGQPTTIVDPNGLTTDLVYDLRRRLTSRTVGGEVTIYDYDGVGNLDKVTLPDGSFLDYTYDAAHRLTAMQDNLGNKITYTLDAMGNRTLDEVRDPGNNLAQTRTRVYNNLNRLFQEIGAASQTTQYAYDNQGNVTSVDGPLAGTGDTTANAYDALNRLRQVTNPGSVLTKYEYNGLDALTKVTDPRNFNTNYTVDGLGNLTLQASPDTGNTVNTYDPAGNLLTQTDAKSQLTSYAYDALNRVTSITFHDGSKQTYVYDLGLNGLGRLTSIAETDPLLVVTGLTVYGYDAHGRVTLETRTIGGIPYATAYRYDSAGRRDRITYPSGRTVDFTFDTVGRINGVTTTPLGGSVQAIASSVAYHPFGGVTGLTFGNSQTYSRAVDQDGRISSYSLGSQSFGIGFDLASRITGIAETGNPPNTNTYGYDLLDRLTSAILPSANYGYSYDGVGNRLTKVVGAGTETYTYSSTSNRIATLTPTSGPMRNFTLDPNGSTTADGINTYTYDVRGRMVQAVSTIGATTYEVNALGQRVRKTNTLGDRVFHYDSQGHLIAETTAAAVILKEYLWLGDMPLAVVDGTNRYYVHSDHLNTPRLISNQSQQAVWRWDQQEPFGINVADENPSSLGTFDFPLRYPGQYADKETNLYYNYFRDYDAGIGRYIESDPIGLDGGINTYAYVSSSPLAHIDPTGLKLWLCIRSCCGGVANHAYLYDDASKQCCGDPGNFRGRRSRDYIATCRDKNGGPGVDTCWLISSSDDDAKKALKCCNSNTKATTYGWNGDCQNRTDDCIRELGMAPPNTPQQRRFQACDSCYRK